MTRQRISSPDHHGFLAYSGGMIVEALSHPKVGPTPDEAKAKAYFGAWAWTDKEAHTRAAATDEWDHLTRPIQDFPFLRAVDMVHVDVAQVLKDEA